MGCPLYDMIKVDMTEAMKVKDMRKVNLLRDILNKVQNQNVLRGEELTEALCLRMVRKSIKELEQSVQSFEKAGRTEEAEALRNDIKTVSTYLPRMLDESEVEQKVKAAIAALGASSKKDMGKVIKAVVSECGETVDGSTVSRFAAGLLK